MADDHQSYKCRFCKAAILDKFDRMLHERTRDSRNKFRDPELGREMEDDHRSYKCSFCRAVFLDGFNRMLHEKTHGGRCYVCHLRLPDKSQLPHHYRNYHPQMKVVGVRDPGLGGKIHSEQQQKQVLRRVRVMPSSQYKLIK